MSIQTLVLNNIEVLGYSHQNNFFGERAVNYSATKTLSIRGYVLDLQNSIGVKDVFNDTTTIKTIAQNFHSIIINGQNFGIGKFTSLSFDEGNWVRTTRFNADIEIISKVPIKEIGSKEFKKIYKVSSIVSANPNLLNFKFYNTENTINGSSIFYDKTETYAVWRSGPYWIISLISNIGKALGAFPTFFKNFSSTIDGSYTGTTGYTGTVTIQFESGEDINLENKNFELIENFTESFEINFDTNTKNVDGTHSIEIEYNANNKDLDTIKLAQSLATELLVNTIPSNLSELNYLTRANNTYTLLHNESYDLINGRCGFTRRFSYNTNNSNRPYSIERNILAEIAEDGIGNVREDCQIKAENNNPGLYENALIGLNEQITGSFNRCNEVFNTYKTKFKINGSLYNNQVQKNININKFDGIITYEIGYTTDKKFANQLYTIENTSTLDRNDNFIWTVSEQGTVVGLGGQSQISPNLTLKYFNAESGWNNTKTGIYFRSSGLWNQYAKDKASRNLNQISQRISRSPYQGQIVYTYTYTDDPIYRNDMGDIKKFSIEYTDDGNMGSNLNPIYKEFIIPNNTYTLIQNRNLKQQGTLSISATAEISLTGQNNIFNGYRYFTGSNAITGYLRSLVSGLLQSGVERDPYLESANYSSDEIEQTITYEEVYKYS